MLNRNFIVTEQLEPRRLFNASLETTPPFEAAPGEPRFHTPGGELIYHPDGVPGDTNGDGIVNLADFNALAAHFGMGPGMTVAEGDFTGDGFVLLDDFDILATFFGFGAGPDGGTASATSDDIVQELPSPQNVGKIVNPFGTAPSDGIIRYPLPNELD